MGSSSSKAQNSETTTETVSTPSTQAKEKKCAPEKIMMEHILLDPRSPDVNRTPLASILNNRLKKHPNVEQTPVTPVNLRKQLLNYSAKELKLLDPRSPSQFIPRTPLNMSFDGENIEQNSNQYSLEYSGVIEEASCRNFNEGLANITFDDLEAEANIQDESKIAVYSKLDVIADVSMSNTADDDEEKPSPEADEEFRSQTPTENSKGNEIDMDDENISPVVDPASNNKRNAVSAFSSTPISMSNNQLKSLLLKKHTKKSNKMEIFEDKLTKNNSATTTPAKRLAKINEIENPRTPFGSLLNRRSKSVENLSQQQNGLKENTRPNNLNDENSTPKKQKSTALLNNVNRSGGVRRKNEIFHD